MSRNTNADKSLELTLTGIERQFGKGSIMRLGDEESALNQVPSISTGSLGLDISLGIGGLPKGRIVEVYGPESSGKTTLALHAVANAQKDGGVAAFIDADKAGYPTYLEHALRIVRQGGLILCDNAFAFGYVLDETNTDESVRTIRAFNDHMAASGIASIIVPFGDGVWVGVKD